MSTEDRSPCPHCCTALVNGRCPDPNCQMHWLSSTPQSTDQCAHGNSPPDEECLWCENDHLRERIAWFENYVKACDNEVKRANQRRVEVALELDAALMKVQGVTALLSEAVNDIDSWGGYASSYFRERHDLKGCIARYRAALDVPATTTEGKS